MMYAIRGFRTARYVTLEISSDRTSPGILDEMPSRRAARRVIRDILGREGRAESVALSRRRHGVLEAWVRGRTS